ncbi:MAG: hypothetical protein RLZZ252_1569 [Bacteroidota bacterium]
MANITIEHVRVAGVSAAVPKRVVENRDSPLFTKEELDKLFESVGIERRRCVEEGMTTADLCQAAAERLLSDMGIEKSSIDALVLVTQTPDFRNPATAVILQDKLGLPKTTLAFDVALGCSGYVYGLYVLSSLVSAGRIGNALLLVGDTASLTSSPLDKSRNLLFGDGGSATLLQFDATAAPMHFDLGSDGSGYQAIYTPHSGFRNRPTPESYEMIDYGDGIVRAKVHSWLDGMEVFGFGISRAPKTVKSLAAAMNLDFGTVDYFLFHQANKMMNDRIVSKLGIPTEKAPSNLRDFGNTSCASIPLLMATEVFNDKPFSGNLVLCGFGVGLSWATGYVPCHNLHISGLVEI